MSTPRFGPPTLSATGQNAADKPEAPARERRQLFPRWRFGLVFRGLPGCLVRSLLAADPDFREVFAQRLGARVRHPRTAQDQLPQLLQSAEVFQAAVGDALAGQQAQFAEM